MGCQKLVDHHYKLGDAGKREHIAQFTTLFDNQAAIDSLKPNDLCFVRSGNWFTFAKVVSRRDGPDAEFEIMVDENGSTLIIPVNDSSRHIRTMKRHHFSEDSHQYGRRPNGPSSKPVRGGRRATLDVASLNPTSSPNEPEAGARAGLDRQHRTPSVSSLNKLAPGDIRASHSQLNLNRSEAGARAGLGRPQRRLSVPSLNIPINFFGRTSRGEKQVFSDDVLELNASHSQSLHRSEASANRSRSEAGARAGLDRPQRRLSAPSLKIPSRGEKQASSDDVLELNPSTPVPVINVKLSRPATSRSSNGAGTGLDRGFCAGSTSLKNHSERRASLPARNFFVPVESMQTRPPSPRLQRHLERRLPNLCSYKPVRNGSKMSPNEAGSLPQSRSNRASAGAAADLSNLVASMSATHGMKMKDGDAPSDISFSEEECFDSSSDELPLTAIIASTHRRLNYSRPEDVRTRARTHRTLSIQSLSNPSRGHRRASLDDSPVDVSRFSESSLTSEISAKLYYPKTRRSSLPMPPFNDDGKSFSRKAASIKSIDLDEPTGKPLEQQSELQSTPICSDRRRSLHETSTASLRRSSFSRPGLPATKAEDLLNFIASIPIDNSPRGRFPVPTVLMPHDDESSSDISLSVEEDDDDSNDNDIGARVNANPSYEKCVITSKNHFDLPELDMVGLKEKFCNEAWYALD